MFRHRKRLLAILLLVLVLVAWLGYRALSPSAAPVAVNAPPEQSAPQAAPIPPPTTTSTTDPAEVFRRAFWRQPTSADQILQAERRVDPANDSWQWFIQLHPSPEILAALRNPENLGLRTLPTDEDPRPWPITPVAPPAWFPAVESLDPEHFKICQSPSTGLTILYREADNMLFSTDHGAGFAPPVR